MSHRGSRPNRTDGTRGGFIPIVADMPVMAEAACYGYPTHWWFSDEPDGGRETKPMRMQRHAVRDAAIEMCHGCPLLERCHDWTEQHPELTAFGIWAGRTARERRAARGAQRRRKAVA